MQRKTLVYLCLWLGALLAPALSQAAEVSCARGGLKQAVDLYIAA